MYERVLAILENALGKDHLNTATALYNLGNMIWRNGDGDDDLTGTVSLPLL